MNQPSLGAASKNTEPHTNTPPIRKHQKPNADSPGNGRSRAPSTEGSTSSENASKIGTANRNIITEPCSVNSRSEVSAPRTAMPGNASCTRINSAHTPPHRQNAIAAAVYQRPTIELLTADQ